MQWEMGSTVKTVIIYTVCFSTFIKLVIVVTLGISGSSRPYAASSIHHDEIGRVREQHEVEGASSIFEISHWRRSVGVASFLFSVWDKGKQQR
jgi:hypothetical protein